MHQLAVSSYLTDNVCHALECTSRPMASVCCVCILHITNQAQMFSRVLRCACPYAQMDMGFLSDVLITYILTRATDVKQIPTSCHNTPCLACSSVRPDASDFCLEGMQELKYVYACIYLTSYIRIYTHQTRWLANIMLCTSRPNVTWASTLTRCRKQGTLSHLPGDVYSLT